MLPLTDTDRQALLRLAREALVDYLTSGVVSKITNPGEILSQPCGAFVTLRKGKNLRGCIGVTEASKPLYITVRECAVWAAVHDPRFRPVNRSEVGELGLEISVLSPLFDIAAEDVEVGRHGLLISHEGLRGLLLPQVAEQWKWDREQFLGETCRKAGLPPDAWRQGARIQAFTAEVFEEETPASTSHPAA